MANQANILQGKEMEEDVVKDAEEGHKVVAENVVAVDKAIEVAEIILTHHRTLIP